jgi:hypothetical protein
MKEEWIARSSENNWEEKNFLFEILWKINV